jgi:hypothetical protein
MKNIYILLFLLFSISTHSIAQKKKGEYVVIDSLLRAKNYGSAKPKLLNFNKRNPENALSHFWLARIYKYNFEEMYLHKAEALGANYDLAAALFEKSKMLVTKRDLKENRPYYEEMFGRKNYTIESIQAYMDEYTQSMQKHFTKLTQARIKFSMIPMNYELCQDAFVQVVSNYNTITDLYLKITDRDIQKLGNIKKWYGNLESAEKNYNDFFRRDRFAENHQQEFVFVEIEGMKSYRVDKRDFIQKKIKLFNYGEWATEMIEKVEGVQDLLNGLQVYNDTLNALLAMEQFPLGFSYENLEARMKAWQREFLLVDSNAGKMMEWFDYQLHKIKFYENQMQVRRDFAINYPDANIRNRRINGLTTEIVELMGEVRNLDVREAVYANHANFVKNNLGTEKQMTNYRTIEERLFNEVLREWNIIRIKMPDIAPIYPDSTTSATGQRLVLRPYKMNVQALLDNGFFLTEQIYPCVDSGFIVRGKFEVKREARQFIGKINRKGDVKWLKPFHKTTEELTQTLEQITPYENGMTLLFSRTLRNGADRMKMLVLSDSGTILMERLVARIPETMFLAQDAPGIILVHKSENVAGMLEGFEKYEIVGYRFDGGATVVNDLLLRGNVVDIIEMREGIRIVANFLEYQDLNGQFADSRAYVKGGHNVFVADFFLTDKRPNKISPIYSLKPIAVSSVEVKPEGALILYGSQGDFEYYGPKSIIGGDTWEMLVE